MNWFYCLLIGHFLISVSYCRPDATPVASLDRNAAPIHLNTTKLPNPPNEARSPPSQSPIDPKSILPNKILRANVIVELAEPNATVPIAAARVQPAPIVSYGEKIKLTAGGPLLLSSNANPSKRPHHELTSTTIQSTLSTHLSVKKPDENESHAVHKPTIFDIISETEKNQTKMQVPRFTQQSEVINHRLGSVGHPGVAEPLTWQQLEREMVHDQKLRDSSASSTSKEGISTWILLSGSDQQQTSSSSPTPSVTTIAAQVEKLEIQTPPVTELPKRNNFRFQETYQTKMDKIGKLREAIERRQGKPEKKNKPTVPSTFGTTSMLTTTTTEGGESSSTISSVTEAKVRRKNPSFVQIGKTNKRKHTTTTSTTTSEKPQDDEMTTVVSYIQGLGSTESEEVTTTTGVPFLILEPKDADFDLPQDRSPGHANNKKTKRPSQPTKTKKKNGNKNGANNANKKNPNTKIALNKQKEKPITTKIYNYLSREVMPTVGVGLVGLVVTAGLASYFFGPLGALRRSYDDAMDRQDSGSDSIYSVNSDEYAAGNPDAGQNEEDVFGKFIAGMPANYMPKYVRYYQPHGPQPSYLAGHGPQGQQQQQYAGQRRVYGQQQGGPKYGPQGAQAPQGQPGQQGPQQQYFRNRNGAESPYPKVSPSPHYTSVQYQNQQPALRNHQPQPQQPLASPFIQQLHDLQMQKSLTTNIESALKQHTFEAEADASYKTISDEQSSNGGATVETEVITAETPAPIVPAAIPAENNGENESTNQIQRRIAHYVVGSSIPEIRSESEQPASESTLSVVSPEIITATHGPRRRRSLRQRRQAEYDEARFIQSRSNVEAELNQIDELFKQLQEKINRLNSNQSESEKMENVDKINKEFKHTEDNVNLLHLVVEHVKDIEKFQREFYIKSKNWELAMTLKTGINHIRNQILVISNLIDHPNDENLIRRIDYKENMPTDGTISPSSSSSSLSSNGAQPINGPQQTHYSPLDDLIRIFQVKALFGLNILQNIRPSFERAFEEVFRMPPKEKLN